MENDFDVERLPNLVRSSQNSKAMAEAALRMDGACARTHIEPVFHGSKKLRG